MKEQDYTPSGLKLEGAWENDRNQENHELYRSILKEVYGEADKRMDIIIGHHLCYSVEDKRPDGMTYFIVEEIPSADTLIFDHDVAKKLFGRGFANNLQRLALEPAETRDAVLKQMLDMRARPRTKAEIAGGAK